MQQPPSAAHPVYFVLPRLCLQMKSQDFTQWLHQVEDTPSQQRMRERRQLGACQGSCKHLHRRALHNSWGSDLWGP